MRFRLSGGRVAQRQVAHARGVGERFAVDGDLLVSFGGRPIGNGRLRAGGRIEVKELVGAVRGRRCSAVAAASPSGCRSGRRASLWCGGLGGWCACLLLLGCSATAVAPLTPGYDASGKYYHQ